MPTKRPSNPKLPSDFIWAIMPSRVSLNHHAAPSWIFPAMPSPWKLPIKEARISLSRAFKEYKIVLGSESATASDDNKPVNALATGLSPMESNPVSGPSLAKPVHYYFWTR